MNLPAGPVTLGIKIAYMYENLTIIN